MKSVCIILLKRFIHLFTYCWLCWVIVAWSSVYTPVVVLKLPIGVASLVENRLCAHRLQYLPL